MAEQHGGYRTPSDPAAASGPGALSRRTDGGATQAGMVAPGGAYGERKELTELQSDASLAGGGGGTPPMPQMTAAMLPGLSDPTARPDEPVTAGSNVVSRGPSEMDDATRRRIIDALPVLAWLASQPKASEQTRQWFRQVRGDL